MQVPYLDIKDGKSYNLCDMGKDNFIVSLAGGVTHNEENVSAESKKKKTYSRISQSYVYGSWTPDY
jgi:hypothetical protein